MADTRSGLANIFSRSGLKDYITMIAVLLVVFMIIIPIPAFVLDIFMILNLSISILIILIIINIKNPLEFAIFPTMLLISTIFGLALNVSSTKLILLQGPNFKGQMVKSFATFVTGSGGTEGIIIGVVIFITIITVQMMVITKGSTRVAEVAARFTLDAMPNKQMALDQEFSSGVLTEEQYKQKKRDLERTNEFFGAMDGSTKFVSGNVKFGIVMTVINIIGGLLVGSLKYNMPIGESVMTFTSLTIGDGLVSQLPSLIVSIATGLVVTRSISEDSLGEEVATQFMADSRVYWIISGFLLVLAFLPQFPHVLLFLLSGATGFLAFSFRNKKKKEEEAAVEEQEKPKTAEEEFPKLVRLDPLALELGFGLIPLVDQEKGAELLDRVKRIRQEAALDLGLVVPRIRIMDNMRLEATDYCFKIKGVESGMGRILLGRYLAINPGGEREVLPGEKTREPTFGLEATWIGEDIRDKAERLGYTVVDPPSIVATHLSQIIKRNAADILGRQEVSQMIEALQEDYPAVVQEVTRAEAFNTGEIQKVLRGLLREQVSITNLVTILETMADWVPYKQDMGFIIEKVRQAMGRQITLRYCDNEKELPVITIEPELQQAIADSRVKTPDGDVAALSPELGRAWSNSCANTIQNVQNQGYMAVLLCSPEIRPLVRSLTAQAFPDIPVLSSLEVSDAVKINQVGTVSVIRESSNV